MAKLPDISVLFQGKYYNIIDLYIQQSAKALEAQNAKG